MSYNMTFRGTLQFLTSDEIDLAEREVAEMIAEDDPDFADVWRFEKPIVRDRLTVTVDIDVGAPGDWWFLLEAIVETYADLAESGKVESWYDGDQNETYGPDAE
jgi:hypothetical protein